MTRGAGRDLAVAIALFAATLVFFASTAHRTFNLRDEGYILYNVQRMLDGAFPHRDFVGLYGPGVYAVTGAAFGWHEEILDVRLLLAGLRAAAVVLAFAIARRLVPLPYALLAAGLAAAWWGRVIWVLHTPYAALYSIPLGLLGAWLLLRAVAASSRVGLFAAGVATGASVLFKQSLGCVFGYGMVLAIAAHGLVRLRGEDGPNPGRETTGPGKDRATPWVLTGWLVAGSLVTWPFVNQMSAVDYALHFLPIHLAVAVVAIRFARWGDPGRVLRRTLPDIACFIAGFLTLPAITAIVYAAWGALPTLAHQMFVFPLELENYYLPVAVPPVRGLALVGTLVLAASGGLALSAGRRALGGAALVAGCAGFAAAARSIGDWAELGVLLYLVSGWLPAAIAYAALGWLAPALLSRSRPLPGEIDGVLIVLFFQLMLAFQIFPRATYNVTLMLGAITPLLAWVCWRWAGLAGPLHELPVGWRRAVSFAWVAALPVLLGSHTLVDAVGKRATGERSYTSLSLPAARGLAVSPGLYEAEGLASFEWLVDHLARSEPADAPLLLLTNEFMFHVVGERPNLAPEFTYYLHLFSWDMLPDRYRERMSGDVLIGRLRDAENPIVVDKDDFASSHLRANFPGLYRYVGSNFHEVYRVGAYRVLRKNPT